MRMLRSAFFGVLLALSSFIAGANAETASSAWADEGFARVRLISAARTTGNSDTLTLGLHFILKEHWKVYWRSAGDAGYPPSIDWTGSQNLASAKILWPAPKRFSILGFTSQGYKNEVVLPITVKLAKKGQPLKVQAAVDYLACSDVCIPLSANLGLDIGAGKAMPSAFAQLINRFSAVVPGDGSAQGLKFGKAEVISVDGKTKLRVSTTSAGLLFKNPTVFVEGPEELVFYPPKVRIGGDGKSATMNMVVEGVEDLKGGLVGIPLTFTLVDGKRSAEKVLKPVVGVDVESGLGGVASSVSLPLILFLAFIGGLILNLMPCVLPVLSIKVMDVVSHGGGDKRDVRLSFIATAAGILFAFMVLAGVLVALKSAGAAVGWGIQFQHPWFIVAMTLVVTLFACNMWGFFEFRLPAWAANIGQRSGNIGGLSGNFLSGAFATLLATPCSAPFLGTAIAFALSRGSFEIFAIFTAVATGLAMPFLAIATFPGLATRLPRPGQWMIILKRVLGFALAATGLWLLSVLLVQTGLRSTGIVAILMAGIIVALYLLHRTSAKMPRMATGLLLVVFAVSAFAVPQSYSPGTGPTQAKAGKKDIGKLTALWIPFDEAAIPAMVAEGKTVFVDVSAEWCITCLANKALVLTKGEVFKRLSGDNVITMEADWTLPSDTITRYLAKFGRYAIPFNVVYGPSAPEGVVLPELLSQKSVLSALNKAGKKAVASSSNAG